MMQRSIYIVLAVVTGIMLLTGGVLAAPAAVGLEAGQTVIAYSYSDLNDKLDYYGSSTDFNNANQKSVNAQRAFTEHWILGIDYVTGDASKFVWGMDLRLEHLHTDFYLQHQFNPNFGIMLGNREYDYKMIPKGLPETEYDHSFVFYGLAAKLKVTECWSCYAIALHDKVETDLQLGSTLAITKNFFVDLNYKSNVFEDKSLGPIKIHTTGAALGAGFKF